jgi:hypothetical protein
MKCFNVQVFNMRNCGLVRKNLKGDKKKKTKGRSWKARPQLEAVICNGVPIFLWTWVVISDPEIPGTDLSDLFSPDIEFV